MFDTLVAVLLALCVTNLCVYHVGVTAVWSLVVGASASVCALFAEFKVGLFLCERRWHRQKATCALGMGVALPYGVLGAVLLQRCMYLGDDSALATQLAYFIDEWSTLVWMTLATQAGVLVHIWVHNHPSVFSSTLFYVRGFVIVQAPLVLLYYRHDLVWCQVACMFGYWMAWLFVRPGGAESRPLTPPGLLTLGELLVVTVILSLAVCAGAGRLFMVPSDVMTVSSDHRILGFAMLWGLLFCVIAAVWLIPARSNFLNASVVCAYLLMSIPWFAKHCQESFGAFLARTLLCSAESDRTATSDAVVGWDVFVGALAECPWYLNHGLTYLALWGAGVVLSVGACWFTLLKSRGSPQGALWHPLVRRKIFHVLVIWVFVLPLCHHVWQPEASVVFALQMLSVSCALGAGVFLFVEALRLSMPATSTRSWLAESLLDLLDERDQGGVGVCVTHTYLLFGCALPLLCTWIALVDSEGAEGEKGWIVTTALCGVWVLGVGDALASFVGVNWGRRRWWLWGGSLWHVQRSRRKSLEGTVSGWIGVVVCAGALSWYIADPQWGCIAIAAGVAMLVEAFSEQIDNLVLPAVTYCSIVSAECVLRMVLGTA